MPRIDPLQLLKCLSVLLSPEGGIMSREEVPRLVNLMTKFSKKLVSKCVYLLILKSTDVTLVDMFMASGGWLLIHTWLQEAMGSSNWNLVQEVLELLLITPVDSSRLRLNNIPKMVKTLSKRDDLGDVKEMAALLVNNWLAIVKNATPLVQDPEKLSEKSSEPTLQVVEELKDVNADINNEVPKVMNEIETVELSDAPVMDEEPPLKMDVEDDDTISTGMFYKITVRDGKQVITKLPTSEESDEAQIVEETDVTPDVVSEKKDDTNENKSKKDESKSKSSNKSKSSSSSSKKSSSSSSSRSSSSSKDKDKKSSSSSKQSSKSSSSSSSKDKDKDKDKERSRRDKDKENDKDKHRNNGSVKSSSSSKSSSSTSKDKDKNKKDSKEPKEKQAEKDKDTLAKIKPATLDKIGRIPKKSNTLPDETNKDVKKKPSISIEPKKKAEDRPKTVKIFNSKMRSTGLEEEAKPPPPRNAMKKPAPIIPPVLPLPTKRPSPPRDFIASTPPEKKLKIEVPERAGSIKLIPPKPKPAVLLESDIFMDALTAATSKKEPKKRKRRLSSSKESPENSPSIQPSVVSSPIVLKSVSPPNFYQDTLETTDDSEEKKEEKAVEAPEEKTEPEKVEEKEESKSSDDTSEVSEPSTRTNSDGLKGVLVYLKKKGPKRSIRWKEEKDLVDIRYFELDETERVNVSRTNFTDMAKLEMTNEREALMGRKLMNEDLMEPTTVWRIPYLVDQPDLPVQPGCKSLEKDIQYAREKNILQALYFNKSLIPDSPAEPIPETHPMVDPVTIPLEDAESQNYDLRNTAWPEPKGLAPVIEQPPVNIAPMFQPMPGQFPTFPQMAPQGFPGMPPGPPGFCPPNLMPNGPPNMMPNNNMNMMGNPNMNMGPPMDMMNQGPMNPNMYVGPAVPNMENFNPMMNDNQNFPMPYNQPNMYGPPNNFNNMERGGGHRGRGAFRRGHNNNNWARNGPRGGNSWRNNREDHRGGTGRICKNVKNHGYCRNIENCPFVHPN